MTIENSDYREVPQSNTTLHRVSDDGRRETNAFMAKVSEFKSAIEMSPTVFIVGE